MPLSFLVDFDSVMARPGRRAVASGGREFAFSAAAHES
jgi:hypothetical protein